MNLYPKQKQTHRHRKQTYGYQGEQGGEGTSQEFTINKLHQKDQQGYSVKHRELYSVSCNPIMERT